MCVYIYIYIYICREREREIKEAEGIGEWDSDMERDRDMRSDEEMCRKNKIGRLLAYTPPPSHRVGTNHVSNINARSRLLSPGIPYVCSCSMTVPCGGDAAHTTGVDIRQWDEITRRWDDITRSHK